MPEAQIYDTVEEKVSSLLGPNNYQIVMVARAGSYAYGTATPESDVDVVAIVIPGVEYLFGLKKWEGWEGEFNGIDLRIYSLKKAVSLLAKGNPNMLELLWLPDDCYIYLHIITMDLIDIRYEFLSEKVRHSFRGYAKGQWRRSGLGAKGGETVESHGYNSKYVTHHIRLLLMLQDLIQTGELVVRRPDAPLLLQIREGAFTKQTLERWSKKLLESVENHTLPLAPNYPRINEYLVQAHLGVLHQWGY